MAYDWSSLIKPGIEAGAALGSNLLAGKQNNAVAREQLAQQQSQFNTNQQFKLGEQSRRNMISGVAAPALLHDLGYRDPAQIAALQQQFAGPSQPQQLGGGSQLSGTGANGSYQMQPVKGNSFSNAIGMGGGLGGLAAGALIKGAAGGPVGAAIAGAGMLGAVAANKIGQGRRTANSFVKGVEEPFGKQDLADVVRLKDSGDIAGATAKFNAAYAAYQQAAQGAIQRGGNEAKVAQQSLTNPDLQRTIQTIAQQLGVRI